MRFVVYDQDGVVLRMGNCDAEDLQSQALPGQTVIAVEQFVDPSTHMVVDGQLVQQDPPHAAAMAMGALRSLRDKLLTQSDWTQMPDHPMPGDRRAAWAEYRQTLRDLPANTADPKNPTWPIPPSTNLAHSF